MFDARALLLHGAGVAVGIKHFVSAASIVAGIDATPDALASMKAGDLKVTVFQNASGQGSGSVEAALKLIKKQPVERFVNVPFELVTPQNLSKYAGKN